MLIRKLLRKSGASIFGRTPRIHRIPFGPLKGRNIFVSFEISPRMYLGIDEQWVVKLAKKYMKEGMVVYDIGAHIGYTSLLFAEIVGPKGSVHAFEISSFIADEFLRKTIEANDFNNIVVHKVGVSSVEQEIMVPVGETMIANLYKKPVEGDKMEKCKLVRIDDYLKREQLPPPDLMKIDIECAEIDCLKGSLETLKSHPLLIIEFHDLDLLKQGYSLLNEFGYTLVAENGKVDESFLKNLDSFYGNVMCLPS